MIVWWEGLQFVGVDCFFDFLCMGNLLWCIFDKQCYIVDDDGCFGYLQQVVGVGVVKCG